MEKVTIPISIKELTELRSILIDIQSKVTMLSNATGDELLTPDEVCKLRKFSKSTYKRLVAYGVITQIRIAPGKNSKVYVKRSELERLIDEGKV